MQLAFLISYFTYSSMCKFYRYLPGLLFAFSLNVDAENCIDKRDVRAALEASNAEIKALDAKGVTNRREALITMEADLGFSAAQMEAYKVSLDESPALTQFQNRRVETTQALFGLLKQEPPCDAIPQVIADRRAAVETYWNTSVLVITETWIKARIFAQMASASSASSSVSVKSGSATKEILPLRQTNVQFRYDATTWKLDAEERKMKDISYWQFEHNQFPLLAGVTLMKFGVVDTFVYGIFLKAGIESNGPRFKIVSEPSASDKNKPVQIIAFTEAEEGGDKVRFMTMHYYADESVGIKVSCQSYLHLYAKYESACDEFFKGLQVSSKEKTK